MPDLVVRKRFPAFLLAAGLVFAAGFAAGSGWPARSVMTALPGPPRVAEAGAAGYPAQLLQVRDGDTFEARVAIWPGTEVTTKVRLRGIDTPERNARCAQEYRQAMAATAALNALLESGGIRITHVGLDKYGGRVLANVATRATPDVAAALLKAGHARPYEGGRRASWCTRTSSR